MLKKSFTIALLTAIPMMACAQFAQTDADSKYATELLKPGTAVPDFKLKTPEGKSQKISKIIQGKYTVVDFWASWCPDCRKDLPNVKRIYEQFAPQGVQFLGISFDNEAEKWQKAIADYAIAYPQLSDLKRMRDSEVAKAFGVKWIPSMMLIDKEGKVVLSTVLSDKLERTLTEVMAKEIPVTLQGTTERLTIDGAKGKLAAIIQKPVLAQGQRCPMVMLCHGFSGRKDGPMFELIADTLMMHGIASIRFDFNGHGDSEGDFVDMTVPNEIEDAMKVYEYVRDYARSIGCHNITLNVWEGNEAALCFEQSSVGPLGFNHNVERRLRRDAITCARRANSGDAFADKVDRTFGIIIDETRQFIGNRPLGADQVWGLGTVEGELLVDFLCDKRHDRMEQANSLVKHEHEVSLACKAV